MSEAKTMNGIALLMRIQDGAMHLGNALREYDAFLYAIGLAQGMQLDPGQWQSKSFLELQLSLVEAQKNFKAFRSDVETLIQETSNSKQLDT